jgi:hypothetical protein
MSQLEVEGFVALVHWFVKLTDPVDLHAGRTWRSNPESASNRFALVSVAARQLERPDRSPEDYDDARAAALEALPGTSEGAGSSRLLRPVTVMELVAQFQPSVEPTEAEISDAFDRGMEVVDRLLTSYLLVTKDPLRIPRRESLPAMIPMFTRRVIGEDQGFPGREGTFLVSASSLRSSLRPAVDAAAWTAAAQYFAHGGFEFASYVETRLAGFRALDRDGDYRAAVLAFATACEILLDDLLKHLLWHEAMRPEAAAAIFADPRSGTVSRSRAHLSTRLKGDWGVLGDGAFAAWKRDVAALRNRVVHAGHNPSRDEAFASRESATALEQYVIDRLSERRNLYPLTITAMIGRSGMERRGIHSKAFQSKLAAWSGVAPHPELFKRWRSALDDERLRLLGENVPDVDSAEVYVVRCRDGSVKWWAVHVQSGFACEIADRSTELREAVLQGVTDQLAHLDGTAPDQDVSIKVEDMTGGAPVGAWALIYRNLPTHEVMYDGSDRS